MQPPEEKPKEILATQSVIGRGAVLGSFIFTESGPCCPPGCTPITETNSAKEKELIHEVTNHMEMGQASLKSASLRSELRGSFGTKKQGGLRCGRR